jgi:hypothetical protein
MTLQVLIQEVRVHELGVSPGAAHLIDHFFLVEELVATNGVQAAEVTPLEAEKEVLSACFWAKLEPVAIYFHLVTHDDEGPHPG